MCELVYTESNSIKRSLFSLSSVSFFAIDIFDQNFWREISETNDDELSALANRMQKTVLASRASSTVSSYLRSLRRWSLFTRQHPNIPYFPAQPTHVALYLQHILETTGSYHSVDAVFYALKWAHNIAGISSPTDNSIVQFIREGAKRILGTSQTNRKEPLTIEQLNRMVCRANLTNTLELRNICMYSLAFVGLLRFDDLIRIRRSDLTFCSDFLRINITKSKNDQLRKGNEILINDTTSPMSPVKLLKSYLSRVQIPENCTKYIFRPLIKSKSRHCLVKVDRHISYSTFREGLKSDLTGIVEDPTIYSSHSLRSGGATKAANSGVNERMIQRHGRWRSVSSKNMYIDDSIDRKLEVSKAIQQ